MFDLCFLSPDVHMLKTERYLDLYMTYIFLSARILQPFFENVCIYHYFLRLFLHNLGVLNSNTSVNILSLVPITFK